MRRDDEISRPRPDLLDRPASAALSGATHWTPPLVDVVDQLEALAALFARGLLADEDFERQKRKVLGRPRHGTR